MAFISRFLISRLIEVWNPFVDISPWSETQILSKEKIEQFIKSGDLLNPLYGTANFVDNEKRIAWFIVNGYKSRPLKVNIDYINSKYLFFVENLHAYCAAVYNNQKSIDVVDIGWRNGIDKFIDKGI